MPVREVDASDKRELNRFIRMERDLIGRHPLYVGELLDADVRKRLSGKSAFSKEMSFALFATDRARCAAIVSPLWQRAREEPKTASVGYFAAGADAADEVAELLDSAESWLGQRGMTRVIAPFNGSAVLGVAALTDAFEESPMFPMPWNPPYYEEYLTEAGYRPAYPLWYYDIDFTSDRYREASRRALADPQAEIRQIDKRRWREEVELGRELINEGFADEWEVHRFTPEDLRDVIKEAMAAKVEMLITTEKDAVRIEPDLQFPIPCYYLRLEIEILRGAADFDEAVGKICFPFGDAVVTSAPSG